MHAEFTVSCSDTLQSSQLIKLGVVGQRTAIVNNYNLFNSNCIMYIILDLHFDCYLEEYNSEMEKQRLFNLI